MLPKFDFWMKAKLPVIIEKEKLVMLFEELY